MNNSTLKLLKILSASKEMADRFDSKVRERLDEVDENIFKMNDNLLRLMTLGNEPESSSREQ